jgi:hypothetical protein
MRSAISFYRRACDGRNILCLRHLWRNPATAFCGEVLLQKITAHRVAAQGKRHHSHAGAQNLCADREGAVTSRLNENEEREGRYFSRQLPGTEIGGRHRTHSLCGYGRVCDVLPGLKSPGKFQALVARGEKLVVRDAFIPRGSRTSGKDNLTMPPEFHLRLSQT